MIRHIAYMAHCLLGGLRSHRGPDVNPHAMKRVESRGVFADDWRRQWAIDMPKTNIPEQSSGVVVTSAAA